MSLSDMPWKRIIIHILLPLIAGLLIYVVTRPDTWIIQKIMPSLAHTHSAVQAKLLANSGADFCWSYSFASALFLWRDLSAIKSRGFPFIVLLILLLSEVIQLLFPSHFTFDIIDLAAAVSAFLLSYYLSNRYRHGQKV